MQRRALHRGIEHVAAPAGTGNRDVSRWSSLSVRTKLSLVTMAACGAALTLVTGGVVLNELSSARSQLTARLETVADVVVASSTAAVQFNDPLAATEALTAFLGDPSIEGARIELHDGTVFATYGGALAANARPVSAGVQRGERSLIVTRPVVLNGVPIGTLRVQGSLRIIDERLRRYAAILAPVVGLAGFVAYVLAWFLQRSISGPILRLSSVASSVTHRLDYSVRAVHENDDEIGQLVDRFNHMLATIELRDAELSQARGRLEERVLDRTRTLELEIEEHRRTEHQLSLAKAAAEEASVAKSAFVANMSHELRTPLNAIIGYSEMLKEDAEAEGTKGMADDLEKVLSAGRHLLSLINDVLDLSKIEAGRMELDVSSFELEELLLTVTSTSEGLAAARGNIIALTITEPIGTVHLDLTKLQQVLLNLIGNACKFTDQGRIDVTVSPGPADTVAIDVRDSGIGMTAEQQSRLFQDFTQADASTTRRYGGTGLGLAISMRLCHVMGGTIDVVSEPGRGSTFSLRLPREIRSADGAIDSRARGLSKWSGTDPRPAAPLAGATVLVVDDDANARELASRILGKAGLRVLTAGTADEGWDTLLSGAPDVLILDVILPGRSGWTLLDAMKAHPTLSNVPTVITSMLDVEMRSLEFGAVAHLTKPLEADLLVTTRTSGARRPPTPTDRPSNRRRSRVDWLTETPMMSECRHARQS